MREALCLSRHATFFSSPLASSLLSIRFSESPSFPCTTNSCPLHRPVDTSHAPFVSTRPRNLVVVCPDPSVQPSPLSFLVMLIPYIACLARERQEFDRTRRLMGNSRSSARSRGKKSLSGSSRSPRSLCMESAGSGEPTIPTGDASPPRKRVRLAEPARDDSTPFFAPPPPTDSVDDAATAYQALEASLVGDQQLYSTFLTVEEPQDGDDALAALS